MKKKPKRIILYTFLVLLTLVLLYIAFMLPAVLPSDHTELYKYKIIRNHWWLGFSELVEHFPPKLPVDTSDIRLYFQPQFLMGAGYFQLKIEYSDRQKIQPLFDKFYEHRFCMYQAGKGFYDYKDPEDSIDLPDGDLCCFLSDSNMYHPEEYPPEYTLILLKVREAESPGVRWNHGDISGVAINQNTGTIVYFAKIW